MPADEVLARGLAREPTRRRDPLAAARHGQPRRRVWQEFRLAAPAPRPVQLGEIDRHLLDARRLAVEHGEEALDEILNARFGRRFRHNEQSYAIARRLNLTHEVCDGILTHTGEREPETLEGRIVRLVDRVAYINHDIDDAVRYGLLSEDDLPAEEIAILGATGAERIDTLVHDIVDSSEDAGDIRQSPDVGEAMLSLRAFMFERVYLGPQAAPEHEKAHQVITAIFESLVERAEDDADVIVDYIAGMTDRFALAYADSL